MRSSNPRKYTNEQVMLMEEMRHKRRMSLSAIAIHFFTTRKDIERQLKSHGSIVEKGNGLRVPYTPGKFRFWGMDVC